MNCLACNLNVSKVVMDTSTLDERALVAQDELVQRPSKPIGHAFCNQFAKAMHQVDRPKILDLLWVVFLLKKHHEDTV
jgi:hypothetical protein